MTKDILRRTLTRFGWFVRRNTGLPAGVDLGLDWSKTTGIPLPRVIFDVGGHHGETCGVFTRQFPGAHIHSFEPVRTSFDRLVANTRAYANVTCHPSALGARQEQASIKLQPDSQTNSLRHRATPASTNAETVDITTLDAFCAASSIPRIDFLKIDTEGGELEVMKGGAGLFARNAVGPVLLEASLLSDDPHHTKLEEAITHMNSVGYRIAGIYDQAVQSAPARLAYFNALFVPDRTA